jgi:hypothetical protein
LEIELKNIIPRRVSIFEFLHSQGQNRTWADALAMSALPPKTDIPANGRFAPEAVIPQSHVLRDCLPA